MVGIAYPKKDLYREGHSIMGCEGSQIRVWFEILLISKVGSFTARKSQTNREGEGENMEAEEEAVIGFWSAFGWLDGMTVFIALLSEYVVDTIERFKKPISRGSTSFLE
ncbi:uncharacterized protein LOC123901877 isoform X2 [Trifolium pratense]|nr:uncharacterized protein LOC123901877 isoform X2 [Trifolium pratense]